MNIQDGIKKKCTPVIFDLQHFSVGDGPGVRTTVFFKGCNLHCPWCHNPESISVGMQLMYEESRCKSCGACISVCPHGAHGIADGRHVFDRKKCIACGDCVSVCLHEALRTAGKCMSVADIVQEVLQDEAFYRSSGGGVTLSGGEPLMQADACLALLVELKRHNIHTLLDSALAVPVPPEKLAEISRVTDCVYADVKSADEAYYRRTIGGDLQTVLHNIKLLRDSGVRVVLRLPMIPGINTAEVQLEAMAKLLKPLKLPVCPLAFHRMGASKYRALGLQYTFENEEPMTKQKLLEIKEYFLLSGFELAEE